MSVVKLLACMLAIHLLVLLPDTLYPHVHSVHNYRSLEPKFRVGSGAGVATRPAQFLGKNSRLVIPSSNLTLNSTWPIYWTTSTSAATVDTADPRPLISMSGNLSADHTQLTHPSLFFGVDSRQLLEMPKDFVETKIHHETTKSSQYSHSSSDFSCS